MCRDNNSSACDIDINRGDLYIRKSENVIKIRHVTHKNQRAYTTEDVEDVLSALF